jgi:hypothetical protein
MINSTSVSLSNKTIGQEKIIKLNQTNQIPLLLSMNSSNQTLNLSNKNQIIINETDSYYE